MKKLVSIMLAVLMLVSVCSVFAVAEDVPEIKVLVVTNPKVADYDDNEYTKWIEEGCGVNLTFVLLPATDTKAALRNWFLSGELEEMGVDCISLKLSAAEAKEFGEAGYILDLADYYANGLAVNCDAAVAAYPEMNLVSNITTAEGNIYGIPSIQASPSNETKYKMWVNQGWLDRLEIPVPTTIDEFYAMLVRFKNEDANGNGDPTDEIPFVTSTGFGGTAFKFLTNAFVFEGDNDMFVLKDGHVETSYIQDAWFQAVDFLKKLCDEGLMDKSSFTNNNDALKAIACQDADVVGVVTNSSCAFMGPANDPYRLRYICLNPLTGPDGVCYSAYAQSATETCWTVCAWADDPELCFKVGDYQFCEEGFLRGRFGVEGVNWMTKEDYLAANPGVEIVARYGAMGYEGKYVFYNDVRDQEINNLYWYDHMPYFSGAVEANGMTFVNDPASGLTYTLETNATCRQETGSAYYQNVKPGMDVYVPSLAYTSDELLVLTEIQVAIRNYVNTQRASYIIGEESDLKDPEAFKANLYNTFRLQELLDIADAAYQRQYAK